MLIFVNSSRHSAANTLLIVSWCEVKKWLLTSRKLRFFLFFLNTSLYKLLFTWAQRTCDISCSHTVQGQTNYTTLWQLGVHLLYRAQCVCCNMQIPFKCNNVSATESTISFSAVVMERLGHQVIAGRAPSTWETDFHQNITYRPLNTNADTQFLLLFCLFVFCFLAFDRCVSEL